MALLKTSKSPVGGLTTLRDDLKNMLKPSAPTFANVSTESFHDFATAPNAQLIGKNVEDVAEHLRTTFTSSLENMGYSAVATGELPKYTTANNVLVTLSVIFWCVFTN